jgi:predicted ABC-type ATPase
VTDAIPRILGEGDEPVFLLVAGPNGASKSTFSEKRLKKIGFPYVNPDALAFEVLGRHPQSPEESRTASSGATERVRDHFRSKSSIALETVFSDRRGQKIDLVREARSAGFRTGLIFIGVDSPEICIARVMDRVDHGGHDVPDELIRDRFPRCFGNLAAALPMVDLCLLIDNSGCYGPEGTTIDGSRHYQFAVIEPGVSAEIEVIVPRWYTDFRIDVAVSSVCPA